MKISERIRAVVGFSPGEDGKLAALASESEQLETGLENAAKEIEEEANSLNVSSDPSDAAGTAYQAYINAAAIVRRHI